MLSVRSLTALEENFIVVTVLAKLVPLFFQKCTYVFFCFFFLTRSLIDRCQIVTETCKNNVSKLFRNLLNHLYHNANEKCSSEVPLFNLRYLYYNYHFLAEKLFSLWKILL